MCYTVGKEYAVKNPIAKFYFPCYQMNVTRIMQLDRKKTA